MPFKSDKDWGNKSGEMKSDFKKSGMMVSSDIVERTKSVSYSNHLSPMDFSKKTVNILIRLLKEDSHKQNI